MMVFDHGWHQLAVAHWLFGPIRRIFGWMGATEIVPGIVMDAPSTLVWEHDNGVRAVLDITLRARHVLPLRPLHRRRADRGHRAGAATSAATGSARTACRSRRWCCTATARRASSTTSTTGHPTRSVHRRLTRVDFYPGAVTRSGHGPRRVDARAHRARGRRWIHTGSVTVASTCVRDTDAMAEEIGMTAFFPEVFQPGRPRHPACAARALDRPGARAHRGEDGHVTLPPPRRRARGHQATRRPLDGPRHGRARGRVHGRRSAAHPADARRRRTHEVPQAARSAVRTEGRRAARDPCARARRRSHRRLRRRRRVELYNTFCEPLPSMVFLTLLGLPLDDLDFLHLVQERDHPPDDDDHRVTANTKMIEYLYAELDRREARGEPGRRPDRRLHHRRGRRRDAHARGRHRHHVPARARRPRHRRRVAVVHGRLAGAAPRPAATPARRPRRCSRPRSRS